MISEFQRGVRRWIVAAFGEKIANDTQERNHRFLEESLELVQSCGCTADEAHKLVDYVYSRPAGETPQEIGGVMVTLAALCAAQKWDMQKCAETELRRVWEKIGIIREKQKRKPAMSPLPGVYPDREEMQFRSDYEAHLKELVANAEKQVSEPEIFDFIKVVQVPTIDGSPPAGKHYALAALCYAGHYADLFDLHGKYWTTQAGYVPSMWPFPIEDWRAREPRESLIYAAALLVAEIKRIDELEAEDA